MTAELKNFLDSENRLTAFPAKRKLKLRALFYLASKFKQDVIYSGKEVNALLNQWHNFSDPATLRRELYNHKFLGRKLNGEAYWLEPNQPVLEELEKQYGLK